jgi:hypothetical protein
MVRDGPPLTKSLREGLTKTRNERYPTLIDAVIQSHSTGFIGTAGSTYSLIGRRRCEAWHDCVFRTVKWGRLGADDP